MCELYCHQFGRLQKVGSYEELKATTTQKMVGLT